MLFRVAGLQAVLSSLPKNSKLHGAWQAAVTSVRIDPAILAEHDVSVLRKLANLEKITFSGAPPTEVPMWRVLALVAPALTRLNSIAFNGPLEAYQALIGAAYLDGISARLQELRVDDTRNTLCPSYIWALADLKGVSQLMLGCKSLIGSPDQLRRPCSKLGHVRDLHLMVSNLKDVSLEQLAVFPGSLTALTALKLEDYYHGDLVLQSRQLASAVSNLSNLQRLSTSLAPPRDEATQRQALGHLEQLTHLSLSSSDSEVELSVHAHLSELVVLEAPLMAARDPFSHPSLQKLEAARIVASDKWRGKVAEGSLIEEIHTWGKGDDAAYRNMPLLPALHSFKCAWVQPSNGRYQHLAALLRRQASTLQHVDLHTCCPLEEMLPRELPACRVLLLWDNSVSRITLQLLGMCSRPVLEELQVFVTDEVMAGLDVEADLGWLRALPSLKKARLAKWGIQGAQQQKLAVAAMLQGSGVHLVVL